MSSMIEYNNLHNKYVDLLSDYKDVVLKLNTLQKELDFFHRETRKHKYDWESMFYTNNERGYMFELEQLEKKRERSKSL